MSVALELPAITISLPFPRTLLEAPLSTQGPKFLIEQKTNVKQSKFQLTLFELARLNQTI